MTDDDFARATTIKREAEELRLRALVVDAMAKSEDPITVMSAKGTSVRVPDKVKAAVLDIIKKGMETDQSSLQKEYDGL